MIVVNIEAYDAESLRKLVRLLEYENKLLKEKLKKENIPYDEVNPFEETIDHMEEYDPDQGERISNPSFITEEMAKRFFSMFWGREDVYARRGKNGGYFPQCDNRWNDRLCPKQRGEKMFCDECENTKWTRLDVKKIITHLLGYKEDGSDVVGVYPLLPNGTCRFIVFDFDNHEKGAEATDFANTDHEWHKEVDALRKMCEINGIKPLVERSRSGKGAHVWIFFKKAIPATMARNFGFLLLDKGSASIWTGDVYSKQVINAIYDSGNYTEKFEQDIVEAEKMVVISSPDIRQDKIDRLLFLVKSRQEKGVKVTVITTDPEEVVYSNADVCYELIREMQKVGINVVTKTEVAERFAVIDEELVWHGGMNLLGKVDIWDNLMRIKSHQVAAELLEIALGVTSES